tara:strand:+ start:79 stop:234 length:156 start_codon:yes stop_codon:yes gene_type:complete
MEHLQYFQVSHQQVVVVVQPNKATLAHMELHTEVLVVQVEEQVIIQANLLH